MTTNGNFEWNNGIIKATGSFNKNGGIDGELKSIYCNFAEIDDDYQNDNVNIYFDNNTPAYNFNCNNLMLLLKFINGVDTLISEINELNTTENEIE